MSSSKRTPKSRSSESPRVHIFKYAPKDIKFMLLSKMDPNSLSNFCSSNKEILKFCKDKSFKKEYSKIWGSEMVQKGLEAIKNDDLQYIKLFIEPENAADILTRAAGEGSGRIVKYLLRYIEKLELSKLQTSFIVEDALENAVKHDKPSIVEYLLNSGLIYDIDTIKQIKIVEMTILNRNPQILDILLSSQVFNNLFPLYDTVMESSVSSGILDIVKIAVKYMPDSYDVIGKQRALRLAKKDIKDYLEKIWLKPQKRRRR